MSENHDPEQALLSSGTGAEDGNNGVEIVEITVNDGVVESSSETSADIVSENDSVLQSSEISSGFVPSEPNQGSAILPESPRTKGAEDSPQDDSDDIVIVEDVGKEDMFVDCPDELVGNADIREAVAASETQGSLTEEAPSDTQELQYEVEKVSLINEVENTRATLNETIFEKENVIQDFEEEREAFVQELLSIRRQLKTATNQQSLFNITGSQLNESVHLYGIEQVEENTLVTNTTLKDLMNECSQLVNRTLDERLQYEATIGELHNSLLMKDQEIEYLNAKVVEVSVTDEVVRSYANSIEDSMKISLEKERDMNATLDRVLASVNSVLNQQDLPGDSTSEKTVLVERSASLLVDNYKKILLEINQLQKCLSGAESDTVFAGLETILGSACDELIELKAKEVSNVAKMHQLEDENRRLAVELDNYRLTVETVNAELEKAKSELEQEMMRGASTKEKLKMAVTKGKALVQQRDALKQSLADKGLELEKYSIELQEKSNALEAAELIKVDLAKNENLVASLQENLSQRNTVLETFEDIISQVEVPRELTSMDSIERIKWLVDEKKVLEAILLEFHKLKDTQNLSDFPDLIAPYDLKSSVSWLKESFFQAKDEIMILRDELVKTKEAACGEIDRISALLSIELQEKDYIQEELDDLLRKHEDLLRKHEEVMIKEHQASLEKAQIIKMLQEESGMITDDGGVSEISLDLNLLAYRCFQRIKEQASVAAEVSSEYVESFAKVQTLLYVSHQDLMLHDILLEEESSNISNYSTRLRSVSQELREVKEENDSLQRDIQRSEEKYAMLREKLSLAVKKGKGLVQDRENMKSVLDEKNIEIEKLKLQLDSLESTVDDCRNQINLLSINAQRIPELEADLDILKGKCNQYEQFLLESNSMLQKVIESIDGIVLPINIVFEEPIAKVKWIADYIRESHDAKICKEQELESIKEELSTMESKLRDALAAMNSLEIALSSAEKNIFQLSEEKKEIESGKMHIEHELQKALDEAYSQSSKSAETYSSMNLLQESLSQAENKILALVKEKEEAEVCKVTVEMESKKVKEEVAIQTDKLAEAQRTINTLEKTLIELETNVALLNERNAEAQSAIEKLETERKILQEEVSSQESKVVEAVESITSLENALRKAESKISIIEGERKDSENEIFALNSKLNACMEELAGTSGSLESRSIEFAGYLNDLHKFIADETLLTVVTGCFEKKFERLREMDIVLKNTSDCFVNSGLIGSHNHHAVKDPHAMESLSHEKLLDFAAEIESGKVVVEGDAGNISSSFRKIMEGIWLKNKRFTDHFEGFSSSMDGFMADLLKRVEATREEVVFVCGHVESLKEMVKNLEMYKQEQENTKVMLEDDVSLLLSACVEATKELQFEMTNHLLLLDSIPELDDLKDSIPMESSETNGASAAESPANSTRSKSAAAAEKLLAASRNVQSMVKQFESVIKGAAARIQDTQHILEITEVTTEKVREERDLNKNMIVKLEADLQLLQNSCDDLKRQLEVCQANKEELKEREAEVSSLYSSLVKEQEDCVLSAMQMKALFEKVGRIEFLFQESEYQDLEQYDSPDVKKLFYLPDYVFELQNQLKLLSHDNQKLQSTVTTQTLAIEQLKEEVDRALRDHLDLEELKKDLSELSYSLEQQNSLLGSKYSGDSESDGLKELVRTIGRQILDLLSESENSKTKVEELSKKLIGSQKVVDELTTKNKLLEESLHGRTSQSEIIKERGIFEAPFPSGSEISEIEEAGPVGKSTIPPVPPASAAHARMLRKGSTDHLAIDVETESDRLIGNAMEIDKDKGHAFKSLNSSGLIPRHGKLVADRIDGVWVSGGRILMSRPGARLGLITYWFLIHIWLLGAIL
ncbi:putative leucine-rich repeat-containing protein DDB_G0290503 isoform X1 [Cucurbita pepo subsp. pepo]|uniref:putative leucine-rich repeat-containing protein DDB_G0290503 isoform X1 n=1 Tax=Cucurbita pepo subsp. pepo TaxID=3664 RepID=UPI000C9D3EC5|nr:putative leucine-rich repeat-containing protein DDB_G0290503 isoform X1 [Cucurbita pepo subsp. pepo]XP_023542246.1 putative leucine-rich repeat-containing protein DDB_G0290503 isoform X1 [Cucurbita pepo subsp. pepo]XP_023542247.1 putative leucine-rich repeat-containing protein DDB_G0290503 isoform X1 [Cucurbita pepo subsp. pepo]XP_023542248.1 putative leucine-rich repeat-containing protein DDB_G0290503 isoform X1 [Cucurbita pepo subsp. pepo]XP_023542249.1 putative leucine-rich repeat-contain